MSDDDPLVKEVDQNFVVFEQKFSELIQESPGKFVLMHNREIIEICDTIGEALRLARRLYPSGIFSVQEITPKRVNLGYYSNAVRKFSD